MRAFGLSNHRSHGLARTMRSMYEGSCWSYVAVSSGTRIQLNRTMLFVLVAISAFLIGAPAFAQTPAVGAKAPDFTLSTPSGKAIRLSGMQQGHDMVLVVLRGFPGYQCPFCTQQVHDFLEHASGFAAKKTTVLLVYPGPPAHLDQHANEFLAQQPELPSNVVLVTDPDYSVTNLYGLRWNEPDETAYPSTFILDKKGTIVFEKISHAHDDRMSAQDALDHLSAN
jgi:thioredoxin-dependent peroxiredoxin